MALLQAPGFRPTSSRLQGFPGAGGDVSATRCEPFTRILQTSRTRPYVDFYRSESPSRRQDRQTCAHLYARLVRICTRDSDSFFIAITINRQRLNMSVPSPWPRCVTACLPFARHASTHERARGRTHKPHIDTCTCAFSYPEASDRQELVNDVRGVLQQVVSPVCACQ